MRLVLTKRTLVLMAVGAVIAGVAAGAVVAARSATATLEIRNETDRPLTVWVDTRIQEEIPAHSQKTIHAGLLWGRWGAPATVGIGSIECSWDELKRNEPLVVTDKGGFCHGVNVGFSVDSIDTTPTSTP